MNYSHGAAPRSLHNVSIAARIRLSIAATVTLVGAGLLGTGPASAQPPMAQTTAHDAVLHGADSAEPRTRPISATTARRQVDGFGREVFVANCTVCHGDAGEGLEDYPRIIGPGANVPAYTRARLYDYVSREMPADQPGVLSPEEYEAVIDYVRGANGLP